MRQNKEMDRFHDSIEIESTLDASAICLITERNEAGRGGDYVPRVTHLLFYGAIHVMESVAARDSAKASHCFAMRAASKKLRVTEGKIAE
jgi:hypothetical protein